MIVMHMKCKSLVIWSTFELILLAAGDKEFWNIDCYKDHVRCQCAMVLSNAVDKIDL